MNRRHNRGGNTAVIGGIAINPVRAPRVPFNLQGFDEACRGTPALDEVLNLSTSHGVAFDGRRMMNIIDPNRSEYLVCLDGPRQPAQARLKESDFLIESR